MEKWKAFDRVSRKVIEWAMRKKGIPEDWVRSVMSVYEGAKTRVRVDSELSEEIEVKVGMLKVWLSLDDCELDKVKHTHKFMCKLQDITRQLYNTSLCNWWNTLSK